MKTYRIEHPWDNRGPYTSEGPYNIFDEKEKGLDFFCWAVDDHNDDNRSAVPHPGPYEDGIDMDEDLLSDLKYICAFLSIDKLKDWFNSQELINLQALGYKVYVYETDEVLKGRKQCMFRRTPDVNPIEIFEINLIIS